MKSLVKRCLALILCVAALCGQTALALEPAERFRRAAALINARGLIAEQSPIPEDVIEEEAAYITAEPAALAGVLNDILGGMDSHSMYLSGDAYSNGFASLAGYAGIGIRVRATARGHEIDRVTRHSPAAEAGVQPGDVLLAIDGQDVTGLSLYEMSGLLQGEAGSRITITVQREQARETFTMRRTVIHEETVTTMEAAPGVQYLAISSFSSMTDAEDLLEIWETLPERGVKAVILDLRGNGGGMLDCAFAMLDGILEQKGLMASLRWRSDRGGVERYETDGGGLPLNQIVVLTDSGTASAAELMAGVLHEVGGATLLGDRTYGKGQGQYHIEIDGDYLVLTCLEMQLPKSGCWEGVGLTPDRYVAATRTMAGFLETAAPLDVRQTVHYGMKSAQVRGMTDRLHALGYLADPTDVFDTTVLGAVRRFQNDHGLTPMLGADEKTLAVLAARCQLAAEQDLSIDDVYYAALDLCRRAAQNPARYQTTAGGGWRKAA